MRASRPFLVKWDRFSAASRGFSCGWRAGFGDVLAEANLPIEGAFPAITLSDVKGFPGLHLLRATGVNGCFALLRFILCLTLASPIGQHPAGVLLRSPLGRLLTAPDSYQIG
jgi:hypothetical protein